MKSFLALSHTDVERLLPMNECMDVMASALADLARGDVLQPLRTMLRPPGHEDLMGLMPAYRAAPAPAYGLKVV